MRDPYGRKVLTAVHHREDLFTGPCACLAGDLVLEPEGHDCRYTMYSSTMHPPGTPGPVEALHRGTHNLDGIMAVSGAGVAASPQMLQTRIADFASTVMHLMGLPVPAHFDGEVALSMISGTTGASVSKASYDTKAPEADTAYTEEEARAVEERLRGLGYLD
jgi:predicted AlkP superfamily phosphohydrolase/phosphomutase